VVIVALEVVAGVITDIVADIATITQLAFIINPLIILSCLIILDSDMCLSISLLNPDNHVG